VTDQADPLALGKERLPTRPDWEAVRDEIAGHPIGSGYYGTAVSVDEAGEIADAVLALLPETTTEWGVRWPWTTVIEPNAGEGSARWFAANMHTRDGVVVSRQVTAWKEAR